MTDNGLLLLISLIVLATTNVILLLVNSYYLDKIKNLVKNNKGESYEK